MCRPPSFAEVLVTPTRIIGSLKPENLCSGQKLSFGIAWFTDTRSDRLKIFVQAKGYRSGLKEFFRILR